MGLDSSSTKGFLVLLLLVVGLFGFVAEAKRRTTFQERLGWYFDSVLDTDGDGLVGLNDLRRFAKLFEEDSETQLSDAELEARVSPQASWLITRLDKNGDGLFDKQEFVRAFGDADTSGHQVHLAWTPDPSSVIVIWITDDNTSSSVVEYGTSSGNYPSSAYGYTYTYDVGRLGGWHKVIHQVHLEGLSPDTQYFYRVGDESDWTQEFYFTTAPSNLRPFTFALIGDMGIVPGGFLVADKMAGDLVDWPVEFYVHAGDLAYAGVSSYQDGEWEPIWDLYGDQWEKLAAFKPYMTGVGNHESYYNYTSFKNRYQMPGDEQGGQQNFWFSLDYSYAHFTFMSTEHPYSPGTEQYAWLEKDLAMANESRSERPWMFMVGHRPMYCSDTDEWSAHNGESSDGLMLSIEPLLHKYGVDLMLTGHMHMYERVYPVYNGSLVPEALISNSVYKKGVSTAFMVQGDGGAFLDHDYVTPAPAWSAVRKGAYGYGHFDINATVLHYQWLEVGTDLASDEFWIVTQE